MGERGLCKPEAGGSIPPTSTTLNKSHLTGRRNRTAGRGAILPWGEYPPAVNKRG